ncbi:MAG: CsbD family protein [Cyanobacteria bacterium J06626_14]
MAIEDRVEATLKNVEGKVQEAVGDLTGNPTDKAEGQAKQVKAQAQHTKENLKDEVEKVID